MKFMEKKYIDMPWKISFWIILIDRMLKFPLRFFRDYFTGENVFILEIISIVSFLIGVIVVGYLYGRYNKKLLDNKSRLMTSLYISILTIIIGLIVVFILNGVFDIFDIILTSAVNFSIVYVLINFGCNLGKK